ncbi:MAG: MBL fold metallo-hydrolase [Syntrophorhabdus sp.]
MAEPGFDESNWRRRIEEEKPADLYAPHVKDARFFNPWMPMPEKGILAFLKWKFSGRQEYTEEEKNYHPDRIPGAAERIQSTRGDFILWIGHATFLMRIGSSYWLTDPMLSDRAFIPRRLVSPAMTFRDMEIFREVPLNVIISHNHYDHLDAETIKSLPPNTHFFVPAGLKKFLTDLGQANVVEMDWWQTVHDGENSVHCLPAQHWSRRIGQPVNTNLWASFLIATPGTRIYYGGDTGYFIGFSEFGRKFPGIDYALIPTTAYRPRWFMHYAHMNVDEALDAFADLKARYFIPTQWGTFRLGDEPAGFPVVELKRKIRERNLDASRFLIMDIGQILPIDTKQ